MVPRPSQFCTREMAQPLKTKITTKYIRDLYYRFSLSAFFPTQCQILYRREVTVEIARLDKIIASFRLPQPIFRVLSPNSEPLSG